VRLSEEEWGEIARFCKEHGLYLFTVYGERDDSLPPAIAAKIRALAGDFFMGNAIGELCGRVHWQWSDFSEGVANLADADAKYRRLVSEHVAQCREKGFPQVLDLEVTPLGHRYGYGCGVDVELAEHAVNIVLSSSSARGMSRAFLRPTWGSWVNMSYYGGGGGGPTDDTGTDAHLRRFRLDLHVAYLAGSRLICVQDCLFGLFSPGFLDPSIPTQGPKSETCRGFRDIARDFWRFARDNPLPPAGPMSHIAVMHGQYDSAPGMFASHDPRELVWGHRGQNSWSPSGAEAGWRCLNELLPAESHPNLRYSTTPYGQVDVVPTEAPSDVLARYGLLTFLGWNTITDEVYGKLIHYVRSGGCVLMGVTHLNTSDRRDTFRMLRDGEVEDLFGCRIGGPGQPISGAEVVSEAHGTQGFRPGLVFRRFIRGGCDIGEVQLATVERSTAEVVAVETSSRDPLLVVNTLGSGRAFLLTSWCPPGDLVTGFSLRDNKRHTGFLGYVIRALASACVEAVKVKGSNIFHAVYETPGNPGGYEVYLVNTAWHTAGGVEAAEIVCEGNSTCVGVKEGVLCRASCRNGEMTTEDLAGKRVQPTRTGRRADA